MMDPILSMIGICRKAGKIEPGEEPVDAAVRARDARLLLLAADAADNTARRCAHFAEVGQCLWLRVPFTKRELGQATGRSSAAVAAVTDIGLAVAVVRRLAELDPAKYDEDLAKLELKAKRAAERKSEAARHEKNLRRGIKRPKKQAGEAADSSSAKAGEGKPAGQRPSGPRKSTDGRKSSGTGGRTFARTEGDRPRPTRNGGSRPSKSSRPKPRGKTNPYAHSRPVKKGKGSFRKKES